jgi:predicted nucleic acid-binding protein
VSGVVVDTSVWIEFLAGGPSPVLEDALAHGTVVLPPVVVAELVSGARRARDRTAITELISDLHVHPAPVEHWVRVGDLRRALRSRGVSVSTPDAHVAQCALDVDGVLLTRDAIFNQVARHSRLRIGSA